MTGVPGIERYTGKKVAVTGAAGTIGKGLVRRLLQLPIREICAIDNNESELFLLSREHRGDSRFTSHLADIADGANFTPLCRGVNYLFHAAAFKHVEMCERSPFSAIATNVKGTENVIRACFDNQVERALFTSSDKAVNPTNVMGSTKLMGERFFTAADQLRRDPRDCVFASTRFGNVAGSRGSVIPLFVDQLLAGGPLTLTDPGMTRFFMSQEAATSLLLSSLVDAGGGEVIIAQMPAMRILDLARAMIAVLAPRFGRRAEEIKIVTTGIAPGEKLYEELASQEELSRTRIEGNRMIVDANFKVRSDEAGTTPIRPSSASVNSSQVTLLTQAEIEDFLRQPGVLEDRVLNDYRRSGGE